MLNNSLLQSHFTKDWIDIVYNDYKDLICNFSQTPKFNNVYFTKLGLYRNRSA